VLYTTTPTGMRALAGAYREADVRWAALRRADKAAKAASTATTEQSIASHRTRWLVALRPHAR
jgi:hypothetical protein